MLLFSREQIYFNINHIKEVQNIEINSISPLEALNKLSELKKILNVKKNEGK